MGGRFIEIFWLVGSGQAIEGSAHPVLLFSLVEWVALSPPPRTSRQWMRTACSHLQNRGGSGRNSPLGQAWLSKPRSCSISWRSSPRQRAKWSTHSRTRLRKSGGSTPNLPSAREWALMSATHSMSRPSSTSWRANRSTRSRTRLRKSGGSTPNLPSARTWALLSHVPSTSRPSSTKLLARPLGLCRTQHQNHGGSGRWRTIWVQIWIRHASRGSIRAASLHGWWTPKPERTVRDYNNWHRGNPDAPKNLTKIKTYSNSI